ncbi:hypothetical protein MA9V2_088 [Chryseobacterium phage MA9V-2]|nr:hypothetical protein MA9V2_088 [Chryseobacterium phage MA9V-2]
MRKGGPGGSGGFDIGSLMEQSDEMLQIMEDNYDKLHVKENNATIKRDIQTFIDGLVKQRLRDADISHAKFAIDMLVKMEARTLISAYKQNIYLEHLIDTLMVRIDESNGGGVGEYYAIMHLQDALLKAQSYLMLTVRQLPVNIQNTVQSMVDTFQIEVEEIEAAGGSGPVMIGKTSALLESLDTIKKEVEVQNAEIDEMKPDELPKEWIVTDDALIATDNPDAAIAMDKANRTGAFADAEILPGQKQFDDDEFDDDED